MTVRLLLTDLFDPVKFSQNGLYQFRTIPHLLRESLRALQALFPQFEEKLFKFDLITSHQDRTIVWFFRSHDRRRYALTLGWKRLPATPEVQCG